MNELLANLPYALTGLSMGVAFIALFYWRQAVNRSMPPARSMSEERPKIRDRPRFCTHCGTELVAENRARSFDAFTGLPDQDPWLACPERANWYKSLPPTASKTFLGIPTNPHSQYRIHADGTFENARGDI